jgi:hypothetical protein
LAELLNTLESAKVPRLETHQSATFSAWRSTIATSAAIPIYDEKIGKLEERKLLLNETMGDLGKPRSTLEVPHIGAKCRQ